MTEPVACQWCGRAIYLAGHAWLAAKGIERGYDPAWCEMSEDGRHEP